MGILLSDKMCSSRIQVEALSVPPRKNGPRGRVWNSLWGKNPSGLRRSAAPCRLTLPHTTLGKVSRKKVAVLLDFVQMRGGGGPCPNCLSTFQKMYILGQFGDGEGKGDPCPNVLAHWQSFVLLIPLHTKKAPTSHSLSRSDPF